MDKDYPILLFCAWGHPRLGEEVNIYRRQRAYTQAAQNGHAWTNTFHSSGGAWAGVSAQGIEAEILFFVSKKRLKRKARPKGMRPIY